MKLNLLFNQTTAIGKRLAMVLTVLFIVSANAWGATTTTYTFSSKSWAASPGNWTSGTDGNQMTSGRGIQVTTGVSGANATSPKSFTNVSKVVVTYSTNASSGEGNIKIKIGTNTEVTKSVTKTGGTSDRTLTYDFSPNQTGSIKVTVTCTTNSIYIKSIAITEAASAVNHTVTFDAGSGSCSTPNFTQTSTTRSIDLPTATTTCEGWTFAGWCIYSAGNEDENSTSPGTILLPGTPYTPNSTHTLYAVYTRSEDGASATTTESYGFEITDDATNWTINGPVQNNSYKKTGSYAGKINSNNTYITYNKKVNVTSFSFQFMRESTNNNYNVYIETSPDNQTWTAVETYAMSSFSTSKTWYPKSHTFDGKTALYVRFRCYNTTANRWVDDISITYVGGSTTYYMTNLTCTAEPTVFVIPKCGGGWWRHVASGNRVVCDLLEEL